MVFICTKGITYYVRFSVYISQAVDVDTSLFIGWDIGYDL